MCGGQMYETNEQTIDNIHPHFSVDKVVLELIHSAAPKETAIRLKIVERCYRILENVAFIFLPPTFSFSIHLF